MCIITNVTSRIKAFVTKPIQVLSETANKAVKGFDGEI